jgi:hypothetical protein
VAVVSRPLLSGSKRQIERTPEKADWKNPIRFFYLFLPGRNRSHYSGSAGINAFIPVKEEKKKVILTKEEKKKSFRRRRNLG